MKTQFLTLEIDLDRPAPLTQTIEIALADWGQPLRWAIIAVDTAARTVRVEAVVTTTDSSP